MNAGPFAITLALPCSAAATARQRPLLECCPSNHELQPLAAVAAVSCFPVQRLLDYICPDQVHIMEDGRIITTGDMGLVDKLELGGYTALRA